MAKKTYSLHISATDFTDTINNRYKVLSDYAEEEKILQQIFPMFPNFKVGEVLARTTLLNQFYSTAIMDIRSVANHIVKVSDVEQRLKCGDLSVVGDIAKVRHGGKIWNHASFASKFANFHNNDAFPILDRLVLKVFGKLRRLGFFQKNIRFDEASLRQNYQQYVDVYNEFIDLSGIGLMDYNGVRPNYKLIDNYLWASRKIKGLAPTDLRATQAPTEYAQIMSNAINQI